MKMKKDKIMLFRLAVNQNILFVCIKKGQPRS